MGMQSFGNGLGTRLLSLCQTLDEKITRGGNRPCGSDNQDGKGDQKDTCAQSDVACELGFQLVSH